MRSKDVLREFQQVALIKIWLYSDAKNSLTVKNSMQTDVTLSMNEEATVTAVIGEGRPFRYDDMLDHMAWQGILEQLEEQPPVMKNAEFKNRLEEILTFAKTIKVLNNL